MPSTTPAAVIVLAAGEGTRMKSPGTPKVLHSVVGRTLLDHVLAAVTPLGAPEVAVVVGHRREAVVAHLAEVAPGATTVVQDEQRGTGHAVRVALDALDASGRLEGPVVVVPGDTPLLTTASLERLLAVHDAEDAVATLLSAELDDATGYGRVVRSDDRRVTGIVEHRDADTGTRAIREINTSVYVFDAAFLREALDQISTDNAQGEEYLTDVVGIAATAGRPVAAHVLDDATEANGVNDRAQLAAAAALLRDRLLLEAMRSGVTVVDPATTWVDAGVVLERDAVVEPFTMLSGRTVVRSGATVGAGSRLTDTTVGEGAVVLSSFCVGARIGPGASVGPFAYLRPGTVLGEGAKAGTYVEMKNATIGAGTKVPHLTYVGDATVGERSNIGASCVFVNYDGVAKHRTTVGDDVRIGSDTMLVAPVTIGDGAYTAAGSVITEDVPPGAMAVARGRQRNVEGWVERKRPGSSSAEAAQRARERDVTRVVDDSPTRP